MIDVSFAHARPDLLRPECRAQVIGLIRESALTNARKRAIYLRWLLDVGVRFHPGDLDDVIDHRPRAFDDGERA